MKFRTRLLILLLLVALVPLSLSFMVQRFSILHFGNKLAEDTRSLLNNNAQTLLHALVDDYGRILTRDRTMALLTLQNQAQAVESKLAQSPPKAPAPIYFSADYNSPERQPADLQPSQKHLRYDADGKPTPIPISYSQQVFFLAAGTDPGQVADDLARLGGMVEVYRSLHQIQPDLFLWQYTALESGVHSSYPGKNGYPADYDPRKRQWYRDAVQNKGPTQSILIDLTTGQLILTLSTPVYHPDGSLAGVTALDIDYRQFFTDWAIPPEWAEATESMVLVYNDQLPPQQALEILLRSHHNNRGHDWKMPVKHEYFDLAEPRFAAVSEDINNGVSAVRHIDYQGTKALWAYGARQGNNPFPLLIVPYKKILAKADDAESYVNRQISLGLTISAALTIVVVAAAILLALVRSKKVTRPVMQLAQAADRLAEGDFSARVNITTGDELEDLGQIFNGLGSRLAEREQMKQSLELAKEIQQQLLPGEVPACPGFELAGRSIYCDETGGDYYDFIRLNNGGIGLAVGDVSGHGIGSALVMATARGALHSLVENHTTNLTALFNELNRYLSRGTDDAYFMTLFYGVLSPGSKSLDWLSAGQAPLFLYQGGAVKELYSSTIPLGIAELADFVTATRITFAKGDILLVGTDGIWETRNNTGDMFGAERVNLRLQSQHDSSASELADLLIADIARFRGDAQIDDDITLMVIKATE